MDQSRYSIDALRISRDKNAPTPSRWLIPVGLILVLMFSAAGYLWVSTAPPFELVSNPSTSIQRYAASNELEVNSSNGSVQPPPNGQTVLDASGYIVARRQATLSAEILGKLVAVNVKEGDFVEAGQVIAKLDDANFQSALAEAVAKQAAAQVAYDSIIPIFQRYAKLWEMGNVSTDEYELQRGAHDSAKAEVAVTMAAVNMARANLGDTEVRAPFSGLIAATVAQIGEIVAPSAAGGGNTRTGIATVVDMNSLQVEVEVSENYMSKVAAGAPAIVTLAAYPESKFDAIVSSVGAGVDRTTGTVKVRLELEQPDARIIPGMSVRASFNSLGQ